MRATYRIRLAATLAAGLALPACLPADLVTRSSTSPDLIEASLTRSMRVAGTDLQVLGPRGFCIDPVQTRQGDTSAFFLLGSCASIIDNRAADRPRIPAILSASVTRAPVSADPELLPALQRFVATEAGRASIARDGAAQSVRIEATEIRDGALFVQLIDSSPAPSPALQAPHWRAILPLSGHLVSLAAYPLGRQGPGRRADARVLRDFVLAMQQGNAGTARVAAASPSP